MSVWSAKYSRLIMKKSAKTIKYIQDHKDDAFIFHAANEMIKEGKISNDVIVLNVIIYLNNLVTTKDKILNLTKGAA